MHVRFVDCRRARRISPATSRAPRTRTRSATSPGRSAAAAIRSRPRSRSRPGPRARASAPASLVVGYDEGTGWAARLWWLLRHFGHDDAAVMRFDAWHGPLRAGPEEIEPAEFVPRARDGRHRGRRRAARPARRPQRLTLVDARAPERWRGEVEPLDPVAGRIPGAKNRFFQDESPLPRDLLDAEDLVVYCGSGVTACAVLHELFLAGREDARLYPGSFSEWYRSARSSAARQTRRLASSCARWREMPVALRADELVLAVLELDEGQQLHVAQPDAHRQALGERIGAQLVRERAGERLAAPALLVVPQLAERSDVRLRPPRPRRRSRSTRPRRRSAARAARGRSSGRRSCRAARAKSSSTYARLALVLVEQEDRLRQAQADVARLARVRLATDVTGEAHYAAAEPGGTAARPAGSSASRGG